MRAVLYLASCLLILFACQDPSSSAGQGEVPAKPAPEDVATSAPVRQGDHWTFASFDGTRIAYTDEGKGPAVVLLHDFLSDGASWNQSALKPALLQSGFRVIVPDLRGNGRSDQPQADEAYADNAEVRDLKRMVDLLQLQQFMVVGHSRGAIVMAQWLTEDPRISKAVMVGMGADFLSPDWDRRLALLAAFDDPSRIDAQTAEAVSRAKSHGADFRSLHLQLKHQPVPDQDALRDVNTPVFILNAQGDQENGNPMPLVKIFGMAVMDILPGEDHASVHQSTAFANSVLRFFKR